MNTIATAPTEQADRFRCEAEVPDPPGDAAGRKQYWEDTVAEAVAELRRRLASTRDEKSFQALTMIVDLEKTRLRHKCPVAGTEVTGGYSSPLPPMEPFDGKKEKDLTPPVLASRDRQGVAPREGEAPAEPPVTHATRPEPRPPEPEPMPLPGGRGSQEPMPIRPPLALPAPPPTDNWKGEEVGPDGLTADLRAWIQEGHDYYDRLDAARARAAEQVLPESSPAW